MTRSRIMTVGLVTLSILILIGVGLMAYFLFHPYRSSDIISFDLAADGGKTVEFRDLTLVPGESRDYTVRLTSDVEADYRVTMSFEENEDLALKHYAYARIEMNGEVLCDKPMAELFTGEEIAFTCALHEKEATEIQIIYYISEEIGNEAENAEADFNLRIDAVNAEDFYG